MRARLSFGDESDRSAMASVFGATSRSDAERDAQAPRPAFRPYDKAAAATASANARRRAVREPRGAQSGIAAQPPPPPPPSAAVDPPVAATRAFASPFASASAAPAAASVLSASPQPRSARPSGCAGSDARMKSPTASAGKPKPPFTFAGKQLKRRVTPFPSVTSRPGGGGGSKADKAGAAPWSPLVVPVSAPPSQPHGFAHDAVMNDASSAAAEFTNVFERQAPAAAPHSPFAFAVPGPPPPAAAGGRPVFQFGAASAAAHSSVFSPFGSASPAAGTASGSATPEQRWPFSVQTPAAPATAAPVPPPSSQGDAAASSRPPFSFGDAFRAKRSMDGGEQQPGHATSSRDGSQSSHATTRRASLPARTHGTFLFGAARDGAAPVPTASTSPTCARPQAESCGQLPFGMPAPAAPFVFGRANTFDERRQSAAETAAPRAGDFTFEPRRTEFVSPQRAGTKAKSQRKLRTSFRVKATLGTPPPRSSSVQGGAASPSTAGAGTSGSSSSSSPPLSAHSPFGLKKPASATRTNVFQQMRANAEYAAPADPFATPLFPRAKTASESGRRATMEPRRAPAQQKPDFTFEARPATASATAPSSTARVSDVYQFGSTGARQPSPGFVFPSSPASEATRSTDDTGEARESPSRSAPEPGATFPGRRILRATRPSEAKRVGTGGSARPDAAMGGHASDGSEWGELKQLGGAAYARRNFREAAELYRQSLEAITLYLAQYPDGAVRKDKAKLHANRAASLMMVLQYADAQFECQQAIAADPAYTRAYIRLSRIQLLFGDLAAARANVAVARQQLAQLFFLNVDPADRASVEKLEVAADKLAQLQADIKWHVDGLADWTKALKLLEDALALAPNCRALQAQKAMVLFKRRYGGKWTASDGRGVPMMTYSL
ncbi:hypothetical protein PybrP1_006674 [[Pythium] brassicae (nom. inval.)]|nr:hypothetical protein PybrP1_006674 [[Pythium] brassicae (nom. inval.)]